MESIAMSEKQSERERTGARLAAGDEDEHEHHEDEHDAHAAAERQHEGHLVCSAAQSRAQR